MTPPSLKVQVEGVNRLLTTIYKREMRLSTLLAELGFSESEIALLREQHLAALVAISIEALATWLQVGRDGGRRYHILTRRLGLDGAPTETLEQIGRRLGVSRERIRQLESKVLRKCQSKPDRAVLEAGVRVEARRLLGLTPDDDPRPPIEKVADSPPEIKSIEVERAPQPEYVTKVRETYPHAYERWTSEEERVLQDRFAQGDSVATLAVSLQRQPGAIRARLRKLGLLVEDGE